MVDLKKQITETLLKEKKEETKKRRKVNSKLKKVTIYTNDTPMSKNTIKFLEEEGIKFNEKHIKDSLKDHQKVISTVNMNSLPIVSINGVNLVQGRDFQNPKQLGGAIQYFANSGYKPSPSNDDKVLEHLKTTQYNIINKISNLERQLTPLVNMLKELLTEEEETNEEKNK